MKAFLLAFCFCGCTVVGFSPAEICSRDGMLFVGRHYDSGAIGDSRTGNHVNTSAEGISCGRPKTVGERCETTAADASRRTKDRLCAAKPGMGGGCSRQRFTEANAGKIANAARAAYEDAMARCEDGE